MPHLSEAAPPTETKRGTRMMVADNEESASEGERPAPQDPARDNEENELEAEEESARAMDADVPHAPDESETEPDKS